MSVLSTILLGGAGALAGWAGSGRIADRLGLTADATGARRTGRNLLRIGLTVLGAIFPVAGLAVVAAPLLMNLFNGLTSRNGTSRSQNQTFLGRLFGRRKDGQDESQSQGERQGRDLGRTTTREYAASLAESARGLWNRVTEGVRGLWPFGRSKDPNREVIDGYFSGKGKDGAEQEGTVRHHLVREPDREAQRQMAERLLAPGQQRSRGLKMGGSR
jgi:hypothetical protein